MHELIRKVVDEGDFFEIQEAFAKNIITGFGRIEGKTVGFVANQPMVLAGVLDINASARGVDMQPTGDDTVDSTRHSMGLSGLALMANSNHRVTV